MRHIAYPVVLVWALAACSDRPSPAEPVGAVTPQAIAAAQGRPTEVDETPFTVPQCGFPVVVQLSGKGKTIDLPGGRRIITSPGLHVTLTNPANGNHETFNITGALHQRTLEHGDVETVATGRGILFDPMVPGLRGLILVIGRFTYVVDPENNLVQPLHSTGQLLDVCALLA
jgi:hypothetical protein